VKRRKFLKQELDPDVKVSQFMPELDWSNCTESKLWKYVAVHLSENGIDTVLVGGAVVSYYAQGLYESGDIDLVFQSYHLTEETIKKVMNQIGFKRQTGRHYKHPKCKHLFVEFLSPPVGIGNDYQIKPKEIKIGKHVIKILSPTDCIKDRLASYIYFRSPECLEQAILVASKHPFDIKAIENWCKIEGPQTKEGLLEFKKGMRKKF